MAEILRLEGISKKFGDTYANKDINLRVETGKVYSLLGENGAGKSTLMNILFGLYEADSGKIFVDGKEVKIRSPRDAIRLGIGMVHQHFMLVPALTVVENLVLAANEGSRLLTNARRVAKHIQEISQKYGLQIDPYRKVADLSVGQQQRVEIIKAIYHDCRVLILDEPTAVLTPQETEELYAIIERFQSENKSVIFISHKLNEVMHVSDVISVLRNGEIIATRRKEETDKQELARLMVGAQVKLAVEKAAAPCGEEVLRIENLRVRGRRGNLAVDGLNLVVHAGEIYGVAGVDGNGQREMVEAVTGLSRVEAGSVHILGKDLTNHTPGQVLQCGVAHIPEDRQNVGILMQDSLLKNLVLYDTNKPEYKTHRLIDWKKESAHAQQMIEKYGIKTPGLSTQIKYLSGGNQQKAVVARELEKHPKLLLAVYPTRGVDIGAIAFINREIVKARDAGCAVLLISAELDEIMNLSDRIGVMYGGRIIGEMNQAEATTEKIGMLMAGVQEEQAC